MTDLSDFGTGTSPETEAETASDSRGGEMADGVDYTLVCKDCGRTWERGEHPAHPCHACGSPLVYPVSEVGT